MEYKNRPVLVPPFIILSHVISVIRFMNRCIRKQGNTSDKQSKIIVDSGSREKKLIRVGKWVPDMYVAFRFGAKLTILEATNGFGRVKI